VVLISILIVLLNFIGIGDVPFHPDESSILYQSQDLENLFVNPSMLVWVSERTGELDQTYRLLNPPIPKYIVGIGRLLAGFDSSSVDVDWNWSATWEENVKSSALPDPALLLGSRIAITTILMGSLIPLILIARRISGNNLAIIMILIFGIHSLTLLHGRRAMSEGPLLFGSMSAILGILEAEKRPWLAGLGTAIAASSKLSAVVLVPVGILAIVWQRNHHKTKTISPLRDLVVFSFVAILVTFLLNPLLWSNPLAGISGIWNSRVDFSIRQRETIQAVSPEQILDTPTQRIAGMVGLMFFRSPAFLLTMYGVVVSAFQLKRPRWARRRQIFLLFIGSAVQVVALLIANTIPFQRYYIPILPFVIIWMSIGILHLPGGIKKAAQYLSGSDDGAILIHSRK
jgi:hypothetical protein